MNYTERLFRAVRGQPSCWNIAVSRTDTLALESRAPAALTRIGTILVTQRGARLDNLTVQPV